MEPENLLGCFRDLKYEPAKDGRFAAAGFDNLVAAVEFATPIRAKDLLTSGNSSHPNSPRYGDQLVLFQLRSNCAMLGSRVSRLKST